MEAARFALEKKSSKILAYFVQLKLYIPFSFFFLG